ncbi:hypothetical protein [uncultured Enterovirga sp.]|uniref:hypothetical protein n=1 Tax=uncultured Enterovirga sp. TaxID=2026352 RepID=UPI0035CA3154
MSRLATFASHPERWTSLVHRPSPVVARRPAPRPGQITAYALSGIVYLGVLVSVFWF